MNSYGCLRHSRVHERNQCLSNIHEVGITKKSTIMKKIIIVTGGGEGLGKEITKALAAEHIVYILSPFREIMQETAHETGCSYILCDVSNSKDIERAVKEILDQHGRIDILINNAGIWCEGSLEHHTSDQISHTLDVNTKGTILSTQAVINHMKINRSGLIIMINSVSGLTPKPNRSIYAASKWAITGFTRSLQAELAGTGIRVTGIYPGLLKTNLFKNAEVQRDLTLGLEPAEIVKIIIFLLSLPETTHIPELEIRHRDTV